jgi:hypothetical protein
MPPAPKTRSGRALASYVLKLLGPKHGATAARISLGELSLSAYDDLAAIRCLKETYPDRLAECDCAEFYGPDGRLIWEERVDAGV